MLITEVLEDLLYTSLGKALAKTYETLRFTLVKRRVISVAIFVFEFIHVAISTSVLYDMNLNFLSTNSLISHLVKKVIDMNALYLIVRLYMKAT